ncbi:MAG: tetratricopeptide repeat protein, partial [Phycisphaerales bacterium]
ACFRTVTRMQPENIDGHSELAMALSSLGRLEEAIAAMGSVLRLDPNHGFAHERLAIWHFALDEYVAAWEHVHAARAVGHEMPGNFIPLLREKMAEPAVR